MAYFPFGPLAPDMNPRLNDGLMRVADGVYPAPDGYKPVGQWAGDFSALDSAPKGGATFIRPDGRAAIIVGTATDLFHARESGWENIATGFSTEPGQRWRFSPFGGLAIATNAADPMQKIDLETLEVSELGGSPPKFETLGTVKGFLVGTVMNGDVMTIAWSGAFNAESWDFGYNQSDYYTLPSGGRVNGILSGEYGLILQRNRIVRLDYVGGNLIFDPNEVSSNIGCVSVHSVAQWGNLGFWLSDAGFVMWDGAQVVLIGREMIDAEFAEAYDIGDWPNMSTAIDPARGVVMWSMGNKIYVYDWSLKKWSTITYAAPVIFGGVTKGLSIDETDPEVGTPDDNIDTPGLLSFDDPSFAGGAPRLYAFSSDYALGTFDGTPMAATLTGNDLEIFTGRLANVRFVRPDVDCTSGLTLTLASKQRLGDALTNAFATSLRASGDMPIRASGRYLRPTLAIAAGEEWTHAKGVDLTAQPSAGR